MAGASLLMLLDDITSILDDVSLMTKMAAKKTAGVLGDDIALNAQQVGGVTARRELPVVWAVAKGSLLNKLILVPAALALSAIVPAAITPLLMAGGLYLCYEGAEKLAHSLGWARHEGKGPDDEKSPRDGKAAGLSGARDGPPKAAAPAPDAERRKIKGAIRTDFVLSAEIVAITLGSVATAPFPSRAATVAAVAVIMTAGVYGLVAGVVKLDDAGLYLSRRPGTAWPAMGRGILRLAPYLMRFLSIAGTAAMFLVGGGILAHGIAPVSRWLHGVFHGHSASRNLYGVISDAVGPLLFNVALGVAAGAAALLLASLARRLARR